MIEHLEEEIAYLDKCIQYHEQQLKLYQQLRTQAHCYKLDMFAQEF